MKRFSIVMFLVLTAVFAPVIQGQIPASERAALIALYKSTNGDSWTSNSGWKTPPLDPADGFALPYTTEFSWVGVKVHTIDNHAHVDEIKLDGNHLTGSIPPELANLTYLKTLYLDSNQLTGSIPSELGDLSRLETLQLQINQLTGGIPIQLGKLSNLTNLRLFSNQLTGGIPSELGNLSNLNDLDLSFNPLTGSIPTSLGSLSNLRYLFLVSNQLTGSIPTSLGGMSKLEWVDLYSNQLTGSIPTSLGSLSNLRHISLYSNRLTGHIPTELGNLSNLQDLSLNCNYLTGNIPTELGNLTNLRYPDFGYNALYASDAALITFLNSKDFNWAATQTIAPSGVSAVAGGSTSVTVSWTPILYTGDTGGYRVFMGTTKGGPYTIFAQTANKSVTSLQVTGLNPGTPYYFVIQTRTDVHSGQQNVVDSEYSDEAKATTSVVDPPAILSVVSPNGGESWQAGTTHEILWTAPVSIANVKIEYSTTGGSAWITVIPSTTNDGTHPWSVPTVSSTNCLVRVSDAANSATTDVSDAMFSIIAGTPTIGLSKTSLNFGTVRNGTPTPAEYAVISNTGGGTLNWTATPSAAWLGVTPGSGTGAGVITITITKTNLTVGPHTGTIAVTASGATNSPQTITINLNVKAAGADSPPFGNFATPTDGATVASSVPVTGWVLDDIGMKSVKIYRGTGVSDRIYIGDAMFVEGARPDVKNAYPTYPQNSKAGWGYMLLTNFLPNSGNGTFTLLAYAKDTGDHEVLLGSKTITCDNLHAVKPFGAIDTPTQGGAASGAAFVNFGWALTPQPNSIATDGSTIWVYIDGAALAHPTYNNYRKDIATLFPGYANSNAAVGYYYLDTTGYVDGVHTIAWSVSDTGGNTDGIGSRYFTIQNAGSGSSVEKKTAETNASDSLREQGMGIRAVSEISSIPEDGRTPIYVKRGWGDDFQAETVFPETDGFIRISIPEVSRLAVYLNEESANETKTARVERGRRVLNKTGSVRAGYDAYELVGDDLLPLPIGASFDSRDGILFWQPGPGFQGEYQFVIVDSGTMTRRTIKITIVPEIDSKKQ